jgi:hypothetical protein
MDATKIDKTFCVIVSIQNAHVFGRTSDNDTVIFRADAEGLAGVQHGDFVYFGMKPYVGALHKNPDYRANWFGNWPKIIARTVGPNLAFKPRVNYSDKPATGNPDWETVFVEKPLTRSGQE